MPARIHRLIRPRSVALAMAFGLAACSPNTSTASAPPPPGAFRPATAPAIVKPAVIPPQLKLETTTMTLKGKPFTIEVAQAPEEEERGLMYRDSMPADHGMLFVMPELKQQSFWMQNTWIPLDIIFLDAKGKVIEVETRKPMDTTGMGPSTPALYVIELNVGMADKIGLKAGDSIEIPKKYVKN